MREDLLENLNEWQKALDYWLMRRMVRQLARWPLLAAFMALLLAAMVAALAPAHLHDGITRCLLISLGTVAVVSQLVGLTRVRPLSLKALAALVALSAVLLVVVSAWIAPTWRQSILLLPILILALDGLVGSSVRARRLYGRLAYLAGESVAPGIVAEVERAFGSTIWYGGLHRGGLRFSEGGLPWKGVLWDEFGLFAQSYGWDAFVALPGESGVVAADKPRRGLSYVLITLGSRQMKIDVDEDNLRQLEGWWQTAGTRT